MPTYRENRALSVRSVRSSIAILLALPALLLCLSAGSARGAVSEWNLVDAVLVQRTTLALTRYYTDLKPKNTWVRYINQNVGRIRYRLRGSRTQTDTLGQLVSISLGQFRIFTVSEIRIALGDDLYTSLLMSRSDLRSEQEQVYTGDEFSHDDWNGRHSGIVSFDRADYHFEPGLGVFVGLGAPESNLSWWNDGTLRVGLNSPQWECALLAPFRSGALSVGPLRQRLMAPGFGAAAMVRIDGFTGRVRFTTVSEGALDALRSAPAAYVHTSSIQTLYGLEFETIRGSFRLDIGAGFEEYMEVWRGPEGTPTHGERTRRLSPVGDLFWTLPGENVRLGLGVADLGLRGSATVRLTDNLWFELRAVSNAIFHTPQPFEHPFLLFLTPRIKF